MKRIAIVTGGTRGIGAAISVALRDMGMTVVANYSKNVERADEFSYRSGVKVMPWDVADYDACCSASANIIEEFGPVAVLINNAGIILDSNISRMTPTDWKKVIEVNLGGCFNMSKAVFSGMKEKRWGRIVNIGSINGQAGQFGQVNYSAAKAGIQGFTKALALEGARSGITVNTVAPGYINTDMMASVPTDVLQTIVAKIPLGRLGEPTDIARAVTFLCQEDAGYITGSTLSVNGGLYLH